MIIGIDASNLRRGGGLTHLIEVLSTVNIHKHNVSKVIIWGGEQSLSQINNFPWLKKIFPKELNHGLFSRLIWQKFRLSNSAKDNNCDLIFLFELVLFLNPWSIWAEDIGKNDSNALNKYFKGW